MAGQIIKTIPLVEVNQATGCPKKKWELLLVIVAVTPTFFGTPCTFAQLFSKDTTFSVVAPY